MAKKRPRLTIKQILAWADDYYKATAEWPTSKSRGFVGEVDESWAAIDAALRLGLRGLPGGLSLLDLLVKHRDLPGRQRLTIKLVLRWADEHRKRTGEWARRNSGALPDVPGETWATIDYCLRNGRRGLAGGSSLAKLLAEHRQAPNMANRARLTIKKILQWADAYHRRTGRWPIQSSGPIEGSNGDTWYSVQGGLQKGCRGLPSGTTLAQVLAEHRQVPNTRNLPNLTERMILAWADDYHKRTGQWPYERSGPIPGVNHVDWMGVTRALYLGLRALPGGSSLADLLAKHRGVRNYQLQPILTLPQILKWADAYRKRTGKWPEHRSGPVHGVRGETWARIDSDLRGGFRGLRGGLSLSKLFAKYRGVRHRQYPPALTTGQILAWANAYHKRTRHWPTARSGPIRNVPGETWRSVNEALYLGRRGLPGGSSLAKLLNQYRRPERGL